jgi:hypothetical protein
MEHAGSGLAGYSGDDGPETGNVGTVTVAAGGWYGVD